MTALPITAFQAADKRVGLTVGDLVLWTQHLADLDLDPRTPVQARVGFRGQLLEVKPRLDQEPPR
ncbi:hypothetical protein ACUW97_000824 [Kocuria rhizophila]